MSLNWGPWASVPGIRAAPGSPVTAVFYPSFPGGIALFVANSDGEVFATAGRPDKGTWREWKTVSQGSTTPGAPVTAVPWGERFAVFVADPGGGVYATGGDPQGGFGPWANVSQGSTTPGAPVTAVTDPITGVPITLFVADPNGGIYTSSGDPQGGFGGWSYVNPASGPDFRAAPGSPVTADSSGDGLFTAYATRIDGLVSFTSRDVQGSWQQWSQIPGVAVLPGTPITVAVPSALLRSLFVTDLNGRVYTTAGASPANWDWVQQGTTEPGSRVTAFYEGEFSISVFVTGSDGQVYFTRATNFEF